MEDYQSACNKRLKATMRDESTGNLNTSGKAGVVMCHRCKLRTCKEPVRTSGSRSKS